MNNIGLYFPKKRTTDSDLVLIYDSVSSLENLTKSPTSVRGKSGIDIKKVGKIPTSQNDDIPIEERFKLNKVDYDKTKVTLTFIREGIIKKEKE